jgi:hypothetical protein
MKMMIASLLLALLANTSLARADEALSEDLLSPACSSTLDVYRDKASLEVIGAKRLGELVKMRMAVGNLTKEAQTLVLKQMTHWIAIGEINGFDLYAGIAGAGVLAKADAVCQSNKDQVVLQSNIEEVTTYLNTFGTVLKAMYNK